VARFQKSEDLPGTIPSFVVLQKSRNLKIKISVEPTPLRNSRIMSLPLAMDFSVAKCPLASHIECYVHSWLQDTVEAHELLLDNIGCFAMSDFEGAHAAFRLMITCAVRRYGFLLRTLPPYICRTCLAIADRGVRTVIYRILGVSHDVQTL
jgi:hypothetical protein